MRLTDEVLRASDDSTIELVGKSIALAASGRFGLLPSTSFDLSVNISKGLVDVESLNCTAITKGGNIIDAHYDTRFTNSFDTRIQIPEGSGEKEYVLTIDYTGQWKDSNDGYEEPIYTFSLMAPNSSIPSNSLPIARIVDEYGWRLDEIDFVPPCLFVSSHQKYNELLKTFSDVLTEIDNMAKNLLHSNGKDVIRAFWPVVQQLMITVNKEQDLMTPMGLLANVQKCVSAFTCACELDDYIDLADADRFRNYIYAPYNYKDSYQRIKEGLDLCFSIREKVEKIGDGDQLRSIETSTVIAPSVDKGDLYQECITSETAIDILYNTLEANVYFTVDGKEPSNRSERALKTRKGFKIKFDNGFRQEKGSEPDKTITLKLIAVVDGISSDVSCFLVNLHKSPKLRNANPI